MSSRREFLKGSATAVAATAAFSAVAGTAMADEAAADYTCDVVVAGAGVGGLAAAVAAVEEGANVILVEASAKVGGTSRFAAGAFGPRFGETWEATYAKVPLSDEELGKAVLENWVTTINWIKDDLGLTATPLAEGSSYTWMGGQRPAEQGSKSYTDEYLQAFGQVFVDKGGVLLTSTKAVEVVLGEDGTPCGIVCVTAEGNITIAAKQVVIATGGFQANKEMMERYLGRWASVSQAQCVPYLDGTGIIMAEKAGAKLSKGFGSFYGHAQPWPQASLCKYDTPEAYEACENIDDVHLAYYGGTVHAIQTLGFYTNCNGKRFVNESLTSSLVNQEIMQQQYARAYLFFDQAAREIMDVTAYCNTAVVGGSRVQWMIDNGCPVFQADTLEELAAMVQGQSVGGTYFNAGNFLKTAAEWNEAVANDTTMELEFSIASGYPLTTPPFYCIPVTAGVMATFGGIKINADAQVIGLNDEPIANFWAVPGAAGGIMQGDYWCVMSGYTVFGRIAGINAAKAALA